MTEHAPTVEEMHITSEMDFIVPLKQVGLITRTVLEAIELFYKPRRIFVISSGKEEIILLELLMKWNLTGRVFFVSEETFFAEGLNLTIESIISEYNPKREGDQREPGWWIQQLIKMGAATQIPDISTNYVVWDGDLVPTRRWRLCEKDSIGEVQYSIAILQAEARSEFNTSQYALSMKALTGLDAVNPTGGGTFVAHHMIFNKNYVREMLDLMVEHTKSNLSWPLLIMSLSRQYYRFSEYKTYATFMLNKHPDKFHYHDLKCFGEGGLRFREANTIVDEMLKSCRLRKCGLSYKQVSNFMMKKWVELSSEKQQLQLQPFLRPAYVQLDHVYGLPGKATRRILMLSTINLKDSNRNLIANSCRKRRIDSDTETHADTSCESATSSSTVLSSILSPANSLEEVERKIPHLKTGRNSKVLPETICSSRSRRSRGVEQEQTLKQQPPCS